MAAPNIFAVSLITAKSVGAALTTSSADIVTNSAASSKVFKISSIRVTNVDGAVNADVTAQRYDAGSTTAFRIAYLITVPAKSSIQLLQKDEVIYLEEGDKIQALASAAGDLEIEISYEEIS